MARFAVELVFGPDRDKLLATRPAHREYVASLVEKGVVLAGGPFADDAGAMIVYNAEDEAAVKEIIAADPYTAATSSPSGTSASGTWCWGPGSCDLAAPRRGGEFALKPVVRPNRVSG